MTQIFSKTNWHIWSLGGLALILMVILVVINPQTFAAASIGLLGTIFGVGITQFTQWSMFKQEETGKFRLAAVDKRLEVHQKAFTLWRELMWSVNDEKRLSEAIPQCQHFWKENCLYLDPKSRNSCLMAVNYAVLFNMDRDQQEAKERTELMEVIRRSLEDLETGVGLPAIGDYEKLKPLEARKKDVTKEKSH